MGCQTLVPYPPKSVKKQSYSISTQTVNYRPKMNFGVQVNIRALKRDACTQSDLKIIQPQYSGVHHGTARSKNIISNLI